MNEEVPKYYCQGVLSARTCLWDKKKEKKKENQEETEKNLADVIRIWPPLSFGYFSLERKHIWVCERMTCSPLNAKFSETSFILLNIPPLPEVKSVSSGCLILVVLP